MVMQSDDMLTFTSPATFTTHIEPLCLCAYDPSHSLAQFCYNCIQAMLQLEIHWRLQ
jgi:hypothetical protein